MEHAAIEAAEALMNEHRSGARFHPFAAAVGIANVDDAYAVQREYVRLQMQDRGTGAAGSKSGSLRSACRKCAGSIVRSRAWFSMIAFMAPAPA